MNVPKHLEYNKSKQMGTTKLNRQICNKKVWVRKSGLKHKELMPTLKNRSTVELDWSLQITSTQPERASAVSIQNHNVLVGSQNYPCWLNIYKQSLHSKNTITKHIQYKLTSRSNILLCFSIWNNYVYMTSQWSSHWTHTQVVGVPQPSTLS